MNTSSLLKLCPIAGLVSIAVHGFAQQTKIETNPRVRAGSHKSYPKPGLEQTILNAGQEAMKKGRFVDAESYFSEYILRTGDDPLDHRWLAILFEKEGKTKETYLEWKKVIDADSEKGASSDQHATTILVKYGDLCEIFGDYKDEKAAYTRAIEDVPKEGRTVPPYTTVPTEGITELKAAAHFDAALANEGADPTQALKDMKLAIKLMPRWAYAHLWLAHSLLGKNNIAESKKEFVLAERYADGQLKQSIHDERVSRCFAPQTTMKAIEMGPHGEVIVRDVPVTPGK